MSSGEPPLVTYRDGLSSIYLPVDPLELGRDIEQLRQRFDRSAQAGMPPHVTLLFPFVPAGQITASLLATLGDLFERARPIAATVSRVGRFPGVVYLDPVPAGPMVRLANVLARQWPDCPPYEGRYPEVIPHLTVGMKLTSADAGRLEAQLGERLAAPRQLVLAEASLAVLERGQWIRIASFPLGGTRHEGVADQVRNSGP